MRKFLLVTALTLFAFSANAVSSPPIAETASASVKNEVKKKGKKKGKKGKKGKKNKQTSAAISVFVA
jgi:hypothetical protein